jgi:hypothetical protein
MDLSERVAECEMLREQYPHLFRSVNFDPFQDRSNRIQFDLDSLSDHSNRIQIDLNSLTPSIEDIMNHSIGSLGSRQYIPFRIPAPNNSNLEDFIVYEEEPDESCNHAGAA